MAKGEALGLPEDHAFFILIKEQRELMTSIFVGVALFISFIIGLWGMFFSHRIAGPLYRLTRFFTEAKENTSKNQRAKLRPIFFRKNDFFLEVPDAINDFLQKADLIDLSGDGENDDEEKMNDEDQARDPAA